MPSTEHCIEQLESVRDAATDPRAAYVIRSRLERLLLSCARIVAEASGAEAPDMPKPIDGTSDRRVRELADSCNTLHDLAGSICRPSESLDVRWDEGWRRISGALDRLEVVLRALPQPGNSVAPV